MSHYPTWAGSKERGGTSEEAARAIEKSRAPALRQRVEQLYREAWPQTLTADEAADRLNESILSVRPRVTELKNRRRLRKTSLRRPSATGSAASAYAWMPPSGRAGQLGLWGEERVRRA